MSDSSQEVFAVFCGAINEAAVARIFNGVAAVTTNNVKRVHLLFQSSDGNVGDGVCLYNFFRAVSIPLSLYNIGSCVSIAALSFLGADHSIGGWAGVSVTNRRTEYDC